MNGFTRKLGLITIISLVVFTLFRWLIGFAMPEIAWAFALGITIIIISGGLLGSFLAKLWFHTNVQFQNKLLIGLSIFILVGCLSIAWLIDRMIGDTEFIHFLFTIISLFVINVCIGIVIILLRYRVKQQIITSQMAMEHSKNELSILQSQLSPHFLFNTLNNLYGLSITDHKKVPDLILKLSDLLRYTVYDTKETFVPLTSELNYLINYIEFEKLRLGDRLNLRHNLKEVSNQSALIAPMLLIIFVENAFKHAKNDHEEKVFIEITITMEEEAILFLVKNSYFKQVKSNESIKKYSGFGLENVKKRLELLYTHTHNLDIAVSDSVYTITLRLSKK